MYKTLLILSLLLIGFSSKAQNLPIDSKSKKVTFMKAIDANGLSAQQLYDIAEKWGNDNSFMVEEKKPGSKLVFRGSLKVTYPATKSAEKLKGNISFKFHFGAKENKYRYVAVDLEHSGAPDDGGALEDRVPDCEFSVLSSRTWTVIKKQTLKKMNVLVASLVAKITAEQNDPTKSDDW